MFVDEKNVIVDTVANRQNTQVIACNHSDVPPVMQNEISTSVMVFASVTSDGKITPPHFIEAGLKINTEEYTKISTVVFRP